MQQEQQEHHERRYRAQLCVCAHPSTYRRAGASEYRCIRCDGLVRHYHADHDGADPDGADYQRQIRWLIVAIIALTLLYLATVWQYDRYVQQLERQLNLPSRESTVR